MKVTPHEIGSPLLIKRRTIGTIPHSQTGKHNPSRPLAKIAKKPFFGRNAVMILEGTKAAITPEIREPTRTNGNPSKASARNEYQKFCQVKVNQLISACSDPIQLARSRPAQLTPSQNRAQGHRKNKERDIRKNDRRPGRKVQLRRADDSQDAGQQAK